MRKLFAILFVVAAPGGRRAPKGVQVIALAMHVDYWNHLGWADPFSSSEFSRRQGRRLHAADDGGRRQGVRRRRRGGRARSRGAGGENSGRRLGHAGAVRVLRQLGVLPDTRGGGSRVETGVPAEKGRGRENLRAVVFAQGSAEPAAAIRGAGGARNFVRRGLGRDLC